MNTSTCRTCGGPLLETDTATVFDKPRGYRLPIWVHARHRDWADSPHTGEPLAPVVPLRRRRARAAARAV